MNILLATWCRYVSGTSFAAALAAGVAAQLLENSPQLKPAQMIEKMKSNAATRALTLDGKSGVRQLCEVLLITGDY